MRKKSFVFYFKPKFMKLDIILVDLAVVALVVVPYVLFIVMGWGESRKLNKTFQLESSKYLGKTVEVNSWNQIMTGLDKTLQKLLLVQQIGKEFRVEVIDLRTVRACEVKTEHAPVVINKVASTILKRIDLEFTGWSGEKTYLNLFDHDSTYKQDYELKNAEKLSASVNGCLSHRPLITSAA